MKGCSAILSAHFRAQLQYRAAAFGGIVTQTVWGVMLTMVYLAFYRSSSEPQPLTASQAVTYIWLGEAFLALFLWGDSELRSMIRSGSVAYELQKPLDLYSLWYTRAIGRSVAKTVLRAIPLVVIAGLSLACARRRRPRPPQCLPSRWLESSCSPVRSRR